MLFFSRRKLMDMDLKLDAINALLNEERSVRQDLAQRMDKIEANQKNLSEIIIGTYSNSKNDYELFMNTRIKALFDIMNQEIEEVKGNFALLMNDSMDKMVTSTNLLTDNLTGQVALVSNQLEHIQESQKKIGEDLVEAQGTNRADYETFVETKMTALDVSLTKKFKDVKSEVIATVNSSTDRIIKNSNNLTENMIKQINLVTNQLELIINRVIEQIDKDRREEWNDLRALLSEKIDQLKLIQKEQIQLLNETKEINVDNISQIVKDYTIITKTLRALQNELTTVISTSNHTLKQELDVIDESLKMLLLNSVMDLLPDD